MVAGSLLLYRLLYRCNHNWVKAKFLVRVQTQAAIRQILVHVSRGHSEGSSSSLRMLFHRSIQEHPPGFDVLFLLDVILKSGIGPQEFLHLKVCSSPTFNRGADQERYTDPEEQDEADSEYHLPPCVVRLRSGPWGIRREYGNDVSGGARFPVRP